MFIKGYKFIYVNFIIRYIFMIMFKDVYLYSYPT